MTTGPNTIVIRFVSPPGSGFVFSKTDVCANYPYHAIRCTYGSSVRSSVNAGFVFSKVPNFDFDRWFSKFAPSEGKSQNATNVVARGRGKHPVPRFYSQATSLHGQHPDGRSCPAPFTTRRPSPNAPPVAGKDEKHTELTVSRDRVRALKERLGL